MDNKKYIELVNNQQYPEDISIPIDPPFIDGRGEIKNLWLGNCGSVTLITSNTGARRASHIHTDDWHGCYILDGKVKYTEEGKETIFSTGELFFTRPGVFHTMDFLEDTKMLTFNGIIKNHENYEKDIVRK